MQFKLEDVPSFYRGYVEKVMSLGLVEALEETRDSLRHTCLPLTEEEGLHRYAEGKWSIKDLLQHLIDSERIFAYRVLRFARKDLTELSGFDQDAYVPEAQADHRPMASLLDEFYQLRQSTLDLFLSLRGESLRNRGSANGVEMTVEILGYIIGGHTLHHVQVIQSRYLS